MNSLYISPIGLLEIIEKDNHIRALSFCKKEYIQGKDTEIIQVLKKQLDEYFQGLRKEFDIPYIVEGTEFQKKVWHELGQIPYGQTRSYKEIALAIGKENACRAIGNANNKNKLALIIPCHRVIGSNNRLVGYNGGLDTKASLLQLEANNKDKLYT